jgi:glycosyltransferase involved in cell wall biosynthesis
MSKNYIFFTKSTLPQPEAHIVHDVNTANAVANLGYPAILVYIKKTSESYNPLDWIQPFKPQKPPVELVKYYKIGNQLNTISLAMPWPISGGNNKWLNYSSYICKYYFPNYIFPKTKVLHTLDWNLIKVAIKSGIPVIYEREHNQYDKYDPEIVNHPLFQVAITVADSVKDNLIAMGMPAQKIVKLPLSFNSSFLLRNSTAATQWREKLLKDKRQYLVVYSGGLYSFKGVDLLLDVAEKLPQIQFAFAGGKPEQLQNYRQQIARKKLDNVIFLGYIQHESLPSLLQAADILAHPHLSGAASTFTSPLKFFEYLASGTPIVATEIPPLEEFQSQNIIAGWCETDSVEAYTKCLTDTLNKYPRQENGYLEQLEFARQFSWESRLEKILSYLAVDLPYKL